MLICSMKHNLLNPVEPVYHETKMPQFQAKYELLSLNEAVMLLPEQIPVLQDLYRPVTQKIKITLF